MSFPLPGTRKYTNTMKIRHAVKRLFTQPAKQTTAQLREAGQALAARPTGNEEEG